MSTAFTSPWPYPFWIAHRGAGRLAPENTLAAFRLGASHGFTAFECDVKLSQDGVLFLMHDDDLDRTTNGHGPAAALPWHALSQLDGGSWLHKAYAGEPPASVQAVLTFVAAQGLAVNLEIKPSPGEAEATGRAVALAVKAWLGATSATPPLLSSFEPEALAAAQAAVPELPRALLLDALHDGWLDTAQALGCVGVVTHHSLMQADTLAAIHAAGMRGCVYTVNEAEDARRLIALGIDGIITDRVDVFGPGWSPD